MNEQLLLEKIRRLPPDKQDEVEHFVEDIEQKLEPKKERRLLEGALAHLNIHVSAEDIEEMRREAWKNFPREF